MTFLVPSHCFLVLPAQLVCRQSEKMENDATKHVYRYIITNLISHSRHTASPLQRLASECSSWKQSVFVARNKRNTATDSLGKMLGYFCYTRCHAAQIIHVDVTAVYKGLIQLPYAFQAYLDFSSNLCHWSKGGDALSSRHVSSCDITHAVGMLEAI